MRIAATLLLSAALLFAGRSALAAEGQRNQDAPSFSMHPLSAMGSWWGGSLQVVPASHQSLVLSPSVTHSTVSVAGSNREIGGSSLGGELGWFVYSGRPSATGFWAGPSLLARPHAFARGGNEVSHSIALGGSIDIGVQVVTKSGLNLNVGYGMQYLAYNLPSKQDAYVLPRVVVGLGWSI